MSDIEKHLNHAFECLVEQPTRRRSLRCSGLPYCPVLDAVVPDEPDYMNLEGALYTSMGTAAHSAIQLYMSFGKPGSKVWGSWKCSACNKELKHQLRPPDCCNRPMLYEEVAFRMGPLTGHIDLITKYGDKYVAWEFKTIGRKPKKPKREHQLQVRHYVAMLKKNYNIDISAYTVVYIGRQHLERWVFGPYDAKGSIRETTDWIFRAIRGYKAATQVRKDPSRKNIIELVKSRPCTSQQSFDDYMSRKYEFSKTPCPLLKHCSKGDKSCFNAVSDILNGGDGNV